MISERGWHGLLLVTSAMHRPRALGRAGVAADGLAVDHRAGDGRSPGWLPRSSALEKSTLVLRELFGRIVYRAMG